VFGGVYVLSAYGLRVGEMREVLGVFLQKMRKRA